MQQPFEGIIEQIEAWQIELVVMATHGRRGLEGWFQPSITWKALTQTHVPVFIVKGTDLDEASSVPARPPCFFTDPTSPILVPLDGSPLAEQVLPDAQELARAFGNPLVLIRAEEGPKETIAESTERASPTQRAERADEYLSHQQRDLERAGLHVETENGPGPAAAYITHCVHTHRAGLIVMTSHGRGRLGRLVLESVARQVLSQVEIPIILIHRSPTQAKNHPNQIQMDQKTDLALTDSCRE